VARVVVDVMLKPEILDPQGKAVHTALPKLGVHGVTDVRQGKRFELEVDELSDERLSEIHDIAEKLLSNPVIEDFFVYVEELEDEDLAELGLDGAGEVGGAQA
jgi:phosphoribosylformylglycinamidine synthase PurS subunit